MKSGALILQRPANLPATLAVAVVVGVALLALLVTGLVRSTPPDPTPATGPPRASADAAADPAPSMPPVSVLGAVSSLAVLRGWDQARAVAWRRGDVRRLRRLYLPGAEVGARDVAMLRRWTTRGLRVRGMRMQVLAVRLRARSSSRIVLVVTDRLARAVAAPVGGGGGRALPRDGVTTRRLEFRRGRDGWVLAAAYGRPLASTVVTSGSENS